MATIRRTVDRLYNASGDRRCLQRLHCLTRATATAPEEPRSQKQYARDVSHAERELHEIWTGGRRVRRSPFVKRFGVCDEWSV